MKVGVTGGTGFIGEEVVRSLKCIGQNDVVPYSSRDVNGTQRISLSCLSSMLEALKGVDVLVHCAFDHNYIENIKGAENLLQACIENGVRKIILLSTVSVYKPDVSGELTEESPYSKLYEPYTREKMAVERITSKYKDQIEIVILQPTIVYGVGGNWSQFAFNALSSGKLSLPNSGKNHCNAIYVEDLASLIVNAVNYQGDASGRYLVSGKSAELTWEDFYLEHFRLAQKLGFKGAGFGIGHSNRNKYHESRLKDIVLSLWFRTPLGLIANKGVVTLKKRRAMIYKKFDLNSGSSFFKELNQNENSTQYVLGLTRLAHSSKFQVQSDKAITKFHSEPSFTITEAMKDMASRIESAS